MYDVKSCVQRVANQEASSSPLLILCYWDLIPVSALTNCCYFGLHLGSYV